MDLRPLPASAGIDEYRAQAAALFAAYRAADPAALQFLHQRHPRPLAETEIRDALARWYDFLDWPSLEAHVTDPTVANFEAAVDAVVSGDTPTLKSLLTAEPHLIRARSTRVTHFDPQVHRATLLHYIAANGVEGHRQRTPTNAVEIARTLLEAGADANDLADFYGGPTTTLPLLVSSCHPAAAGLQVPLIHVLVDYGATVTAETLHTALVFGYPAAAQALVDRGAPVETLPAVAGLGRLEEARALLPNASELDRQSALALAAALGHAPVVELLLDAGADPNQFNPPRHHAHSTPLHQAALAGHAEVVDLLLRRGVRTDIPDTIYHATPAGWARHGGHPEIAARIEKFQAP